MNLQSLEQCLANSGTSANVSHFNTYSSWGFPGDAVVKTSPSTSQGAGLIPDQGDNTWPASRPKNRNLKQKQYCPKFNEDFKKGPRQKNL